MHKRIRFARGTSAKRSVSTLKPAEGQPVFETDTRKLYIGEKDSNDNLKELKDLDAINAANADKVLDSESGNFINIRIVNTYPAQPEADTLYLVKL